MARNAEEMLAMSINGAAIAGGASVSHAFAPESVTTLQGVITGVGPAIPDDGAGPSDGNDTSSRAFFSARGLGHWRGVCSSASACFRSPERVAGGAGSVLAIRVAQSNSRAHASASHRSNVSGDQPRSPTSKR